jgi:hypothetical protein
VPGGFGLVDAGHFGQLVDAGLFGEWIDSGLLGQGLGGRVAGQLHAEVSQLRALAQLARGALVGRFGLTGLVGVQLDNLCW